MLIAIDGACKRNGDPTCVSVGVAWIETEQGDLLFKSKIESGSTSQRGELNGLLEALDYAHKNAADDEDIIIVTDSEYMHNTVALKWYDKWHHNNWVGADGTTVKNADMWRVATHHLDNLNYNGERVYMQWTKGHLINYTPGNIKKAMLADPTGIELLTRVNAVAQRPADMDRIIDDFIRQRRTHDKDAPPREVALVWAVANTMADCIASFLVKTLDDMLT